MQEQRLALGLDIGSVSVNAAVLDQDGHILETRYVRHKGRPMQTAASLIEELKGKYRDSLEYLYSTGTGGRVVQDILGGEFVNEVVAQAAATRQLHPEVKTIIEIGGEDSKLIFLRDADHFTSVGGAVANFEMNTVCAAGTGSFLDQQASRMGLDIEEFGKMALKSKNPPRVAGRCSVFAKSDMIHLQQKATPVEDIVAGLCFALARNFKSTVGSARSLDLPVAFQGGVAANPGIVRALQSVYGLDDSSLIIPEHYGCMGAIGAVLAGKVSQNGNAKPDFNAVEKLLLRATQDDSKLEPLAIVTSKLPDTNDVDPIDASGGRKVPAYLGVDIGSISTNVVIIDENKRVLAKRYLMTASRPIEAVRRGLREIGEEIGDKIEVRGVCTTGSGRYLIADLIGADVVKNEITAQARAAAEIDPEVDTIFEIGGQDSKYIGLHEGAIVDFEMNKVCAAGTGSFLEEQAEKLGVDIKGEFSELALSAKNPVNLGERCTVFMETELVRNQGAGAAVEDLVAGLCYSVVRNYLNKVVGTKKIGKKIFFQGGTAFNHGVVAAFEKVTGRPITVPKHHEVTGAIGCALLALENDKGQGTKFRGFDLGNREYQISSFECKECANRCEINRVTSDGEKPLFYGSRCEKFDVDRHRSLGDDIPDHFAERQEMLTREYIPSKPLPQNAPKIGFPRALLYFELYPFWQAFFKELGCQIIVSDPTNKQIVHSGAERSVAETCFPMKVALGHVLNLLEKDLDYIFIPSVINLPMPDRRMTDSFVCPYVQSFAYTVKSAVDFEEAGVKLLQPVVYLQLGEKRRFEALKSVGKQLGKKPAEIRSALRAAQKELERFQSDLRRRGAEILREMPEDERAIVIVSRAYNGCDPGANLEIPRKLRNMGIRALPMDMLPLDSVVLPEDWKNMYWRYGQKILSAAEIIAEDNRLFPLYLTNFGCGPDSFVHKFFRERLGAKPCLVIEVDEHSADAGMITRCEAFLDSLENVAGRNFEGGRRFVPVNLDGKGRTVMIPNMSPHAYVLAAAFQACGMNAEVLPPPDDETIYWGWKYTTGKECFPCTVTTGDMVKFAKRPDFDRNKYAFFMGGSGGPCRFGQYNALQRMVLDDLGYSDVPIYAPNQASSFYDDIGIVGQTLLTLGWRGIVMVDILEKALRETRPYEIEKGAADKAFKESLDIVCKAIREKPDLVSAMKEARQLFDSIETDRSKPRPIIGLVGEFYVRANAFSNQDLVLQIEALGGEVWSAPILEWFLYRNVRRSMRAQLAGDYWLAIKNNLKDRVMRRDERILSEPFKGFLRNLHEPSSEEILQMAAPYIDRSFEGEAIMTVGKAVDFIRKNLAGIVAVMPFTCMPGTIANAVLKRVRQDLGDFPFINMVYDGLEQSTSLTRLEAFMHQARDYADRKNLVNV